VNLALSGDEPWPQELADAPAVRRYLAQTTPAAERMPDLETALARYEEHLRARDLSDKWIGISIATLRRMCSAHHPEEMTPDDAERWVAESAARGTRNKRLQIGGRFCRWLVGRGWLRADPFAQLKTIRELDPDHEIVALSPQERDAVLDAADGIDGGLAVWIAALAGLRRGEVYALRWRDVHLETGQLVARGKTGSRTVPVATRLQERLARDRRRGAEVVPTSRSVMGEAKRLCGRLERALPDMAPELLRFGALRHTFASLLVQRGVPLDVVAAYMGNSPEVCRRHYARFVPAGGRGEWIDLMP
jgi:integrase